MVRKKIFIEESYGDYYYCYIGYNSLSSEKLFTISFSSDEKEDNLNFLFWDKAGLIVFDTGRKLYFIDDKLDIKHDFEITLPLIGLYLTEENNLLVLEEASFRVLNSSGQILKRELLDLIIDFSLENNYLHIVTIDGERVVFSLV
jgi:hypothetical protein